ncbi:MAG: hypothetical protein IJC72_03685 [Clostridia bacterium]|nr:hypothetical protein [Clostridia bacterium]
MFIRKFIGIATIITSLNEEYDIVHQFRHMDGGAVTANNPVEFHTVSIKNKVTGQGTYIAQASDEASPCQVNSDFIGGNHGQADAILVYSPAHGKTVSDVGAIYKDQNGVKFTLVRVQNEDYLLFISENVGESVTKYKFVRTITGNLDYIANGADTNGIKIVEQTERTYLSSAIRHKQRKLVGYIDGKPRTVESTLECDYAEIIEEYDIINPATVAPALTNERPNGGYTKTINLSDFGEPMVNHKMTYRFTPDGAVLCDFEVTALGDTVLERFFAVMHQGFHNLYGGVNHRYIPKLKTFTTDEGTFDFSVPYPLSGAPFPNCFYPSKEHNENPDYPTERFVDYSKDADGNLKLAFAMGYLPVFDGVPEVRKKVNCPIFIIRTRKGYPHFMDGEFAHARGVAYKRYFFADKDSSVYAIPYGEKKYIYFDFFESNTLSYPVSGKVTPFEIKDAEYKIENGNLTVSSNKGFAVFIEE